jgi:hypothetical protein
MSALPPSGRRRSSPARTLLPGHGSYGLIRQSRSALPYFGLSLVRGVSAGCYQPLLPAGLSRRYFCDPSLGAWAPATAVPWSASACFFLHVIGLPPYTIEVGFPRIPVKTISRRIAFSRLQPFRYVQAPKFARLPDRSHRCDLSSQGGRGFYVRAEHASLPPHASDMLTTCPGNWWCGDLHPTRFTALSAAPVQWRFFAKLLEHANADDRIVQYC